MIGFLIFYGGGMVIFLSFVGLYWFMRNRYDDAMNAMGRELSNKECMEKAEEISDFLHSVNEGEPLYKKCLKAGMKTDFYAGSSAAVFIRVVHMLGCEIVIRQVDTKDIEDPRVTKEMTTKHIEWLESGRRCAMRADEEKNGFKYY